jgi:hypothetical protein
MPYTPVFSQGVKFIKIARIDKQGKDNTLSLQELNSIRIDYSDTNIIEYPITSISKYDDYFLFGVATTNATSSTDNYILDYKFKAGWTGSLTDVSTILSAYNLSGSVNYDNLDYFNTSSGQYVLGNQPNIPITIISSASVFTTGSQVGQLLIFSNLYGTVAQSTFFNPNNTTVVVSASYTTVPTSGESFYLAMTTTGPINATASFFVTQSINPTVSSSDLVVLQPYIDEDFFVSDYNVLAGNAVIPRFSELYMDVDYSTNTIQAVNQSQIIDGTATRAAVQDSNYTTAAYINSRYIGKELNSAKFNEWTFGDISYGKTPNVSNPEVNFASFKSLNGTSPHWGNNNVDMTQVNIEYIIGNDNTITKPINDSEEINFGTVNQTFEESKSASLFLNNVEISGSNLATLNGQWPIFKGGYRIEPIIYTQTASYNSNGNIIGFGYTGSIIFVQGEQNGTGSVNDYRLFAVGDFQSISPSDTFPKVIEFITPRTLGMSASFNSSTTFTYQPIGTPANISGSGYVLNFEISLYATDPFFSFPFGNAIVTYQLQKNGIGVANIQINHWSDIGGVLKYIDRNVLTSDVYRVVALNITQADPAASDYLTQVNLNNDWGTGNTPFTFWKVSQFPSPGTGICTDFWERSGSSNNILLAKTGSDSLTGLNNYYGQKQKSIEKSGFNLINIDFEPQPNDEIRFEGLESLTFQISSSTQSGLQLQLNLYEDIPANVNLDYFLLRRYVKDPSSVILNVNYPIPDNSGSSNSTGNGILKPQYVTKEVDTIIQNSLTQNLI